jgi:TolA-binding protein
MNEWSDELSDIKREIVESRALVIKTNHLTSALAADLRAIGKRQQSFERTAFYNSAVAFALFAAVVIGAVYVAWEARVESITRSTQQASEAAERARNDLEANKSLQADRARAESAAAAFYELVRAGRRREILEGFAKLREQPLSRAESAFFGDAVDRAKSELSVESYQSGLDSARAGRWVESARALEESLALTDQASHSPTAKLELARAYRKLGRQRDAVPILSALSEASPNPEVLDDATFLLAECLIDLQAYNDARATLRSFVRRFPNSTYVNDAKLALSDLNLKR